jgi:hypothetical protein
MTLPLRHPYFRSDIVKRHALNKDITETKNTEQVDVLKQQGYAFMPPIPVIYPGIAYWPFPVPLK